MHIHSIHYSLQIYSSLVKTFSSMDSCNAFSSQVNTNYLVSLASYPARSTRHKVQGTIWSLPFNFSGRRTKTCGLHTLSRCTWSMSFWSKLQMKAHTVSFFFKKMQWWFQSMDSIGRPIPVSWVKVVL